MSADTEGRVFTEVDFDSEIVFNASAVAEDDEAGDDGEIQMNIDEGTEVPMEICSDELDSYKRRQRTKPRVNDPVGKQVRYIIVQ